MNANRVLKKVRAVIEKGPSTARNIVFSRFDYWPTGRLRNEAMRNMPVYCISLLNSKRRRGIIESQVSQLGLTAFEFIDAIDASKLDVPELVRTGIYDEAATKKIHGYTLSKSQIACSLSHGLAYDTIVARGHEVAMVIEDDALFVASQMDRVDLGVLPKDWDVVFLSSFVGDRPLGKRVAGILYPGDAYGGSAAAYVLSKKGAKRFAADYKPVNQAADGYTGRKDVVRFISSPDCVLNGSLCYYYNSLVDSTIPVIGRPKSS